MFIERVVRKNVVALFFVSKAFLKVFLVYLFGWSHWRFVNGILLLNRDNRLKMTMLLFWRGSFKYVKLLNSWSRNRAGFLECHLKLNNLNTHLTAVKYRINLSIIACCIKLFYVNNYSRQWCMKIVTRLTAFG